jgi:predicted anti-sigma-YlaC factor YlaD
VKCPELVHALNEYLDGETQSALCRAFQEHLAGCAACRIVIDNVRQTITLYRDSEATPLPAGLHERIRAIIQNRWATEPHGFPQRETFHLGDCR